MPMVWIPAATISMGEDGASAAVSVSGFFVDPIEVTVGAYRACVADGRCTPAAERDPDAPLPSTYEPDLSAYCGGREAVPDAFPVLCVTWQQADAYCRQRGARLPTEAEWQLAASGPEGLLHPWGDAAADAEHVCANRLEGPCPVGARPAGRSIYGLWDMSGNAAEWVSDWKADYPTEPRSDPLGPATGHDKVVRGGSWTNFGAGWLATTDRFWRRPDTTSGEIGFRCARDEAQPSSGP